MGETTREPQRSASPHTSSAGGHAHPSACSSRCHRGLSGSPSFVGPGPQASRGPPGGARGSMFAVSRHFLGATGGGANPLERFPEGL